MERLVEKLSTCKVKAHFSFSAADVDAALNDARAVVDDLKKRPLGEKQVGKNLEETAERAALTRATRSLVENAITNAVDEGGIRLTSNPQAEIEKLVEQGSPYEFSIDLNVVPQLDLSSYDPVEVVLDGKLEATEADIDARLEEIRGRCAEVEKDSEKPISENDIVELSFESFIDGKEYEGSKASSFSYTLGSGYLPQAFEDGLLGLFTGESKTIEFIVPSDYENQEIAGKHARFDVKIGRIASCTLPEINDAFAQSFGYDNLSAWREKIAGEIAHEKEARREGEREKLAREALAARIVDEIDDQLIVAQTESMFSAFKADLEQQGVQFAEYCRFLGLTENAVRDEMRIESEIILRENLALESLFRHEGLIVTEREIQKTADALAEKSGMKEPLTLANLLPQQKEALREMTIHRLATEVLMRKAIFKFE